MAVYVDDAQIPFGRMVVCHMLADTEEELHAMAERIGLHRRWHQSPGTWRSHYDVALARRELAVLHGAIEITRREAVRVRRRHRAMCA
ncbi:conserved hypothetical protein (plasmid) [Thioalkalivibrio sp. K90mix]|nr:DUF4031 domain-containing protein [Thioalkalivibrio sp. K90mix]ADC73143.1 conserved hypothetical protein [Thioalkalivibrio sp. K90mix]